MLSRFLTEVIITCSLLLEATTMIVRRKNVQELAKGQILVWKAPQVILIHKEKVVWMVLFWFSESLSRSDCKRFHHANFHVYAFLRWHVLGSLSCQPQQHKSLRILSTTQSSAILSSSLYLRSLYVDTCNKQIPGVDSNRPGRTGGSREVWTRPVTRRTRLCALLLDTFSMIYASHC